MSNGQTPSSLEAGLSIIIPVFNSEATLKELLQTLKDVLIVQAKPYEIILIEDGSRDRSWEVILVQLQKHPEIRAFRMMRNYGQHNAILCGIREAKFDVIVTIDDDLQNPPSEISKLLDKLSEGFDVVYGTPIKQQHGFLRDLASYVTKLTLQGTMGAETARQVSAFRAFRTYLREAFSEYRGPSPSIDVLLTWGTKQFAAIPVRHDPRMAGISNYTFFKLLTHAFNMMTGFSAIPLQVAGFVGLSFALFGAILLVYVLVRYAIEGTTVAGFPFLASIISIFSGAQLFALGIIGEYLARVHFRMMDRPTYVVKTLICSESREQK